MPTVDKTHPRFGVPAGASPYIGAITIQSTETREHVPRVVGGLAKSGQVRPQTIEVNAIRASLHEAGIRSCIPPNPIARPKSAGTGACIASATASSA